MHMPDGEFIGSLGFITAMEAHDNPIEAYVFQDEYHTKYWPQHRKAVYERNVDWLNFWLRDEESNDPLLEARNQRWRKFRELRTSR